MTYIIAEAGANATAGIDDALGLIVAARHAGADAFKVQLFRAGDLYPVGTAQYEAAPKAEMDEEWVNALAKQCSWADIDFGCSAFGPWAVDVVDPFVRWHKIASLELTDTALVDHVASKRKPIILSTGAATAEEVGVIRRRIEASWWGARVCVMQCTCAYPTPDDEVDLLAMTQLGSCFGYSDHTLGIDAAVGAAYLGASVIEKHLRLPTTPKDSPDYGHSIEPDQFAEMVRRIRLAEEHRGSYSKFVRPSERELRKWQHAPGGLRGGMNLA